VPEHADDNPEPARLRARVAALETIGRELIDALLEVPTDYRELSDPRLLHYSCIVNGVGLIESDFSVGTLVLEREITCGGHIGWQDGKWHLFRSCGCSVNNGAETLYMLIESLADVT
jgi:hypothetical protein